MPRSAKVTEYLKECIADAILLLLKEKSINKITADEIAAVSGVGRATYFRYFKKKEEAITFKFIKMWERWAEENGVTITDEFATENARTFFLYNLSIKDTLLLVYKNNLQDAVYDSVKYCMRPKGLNAGEHYKAAFYSNGLFGLLDEWVRRGFAESVGEMALYVKNLFIGVM
ncbi:MAG: TetR/AcrR family transcriptional regulator [Clostridia bacterium]|nr:TetR/AcrR family transcriptional regulator [Clostridia bacterium]